VIFVVPSAALSESVIYERQERADWTRQPAVPEALEPVTRAITTLLEPLSAVRRVVPHE
jgi:hypothetical protein